MRTSNRHKVKEWDGKKGKAFLATSVSCDVAEELIHWRGKCLCQPMKRHCCFPTKRGWMNCSNKKPFAICDFVNQFIWCSHKIALVLTLDQICLSELCSAPNDVNVWGNRNWLFLRFQHSLLSNHKQWRAIAPDCEKSKQKWKREIADHFKLALIDGDWLVLLLMCPNEALSQTHGQCWNQMGKRLVNDGAKMFIIKLCNPSIFIKICIWQKHSNSRLGHKTNHQSAQLRCSQVSNVKWNAQKTPWNFGGLGQKEWLPWTTGECHQKEWLSWMLCDKLNLRFTAIASGWSIPCLQQLVISKENPCKHKSLQSE